MEQQVGYDLIVEELKKMLDLHAPWEHEITYTQCAGFRPDILFIMFTIINYNNASFRIEPDTTFYNIAKFLHNHRDSEQSKYDKKVEDIKAKLAIEFKHENFKYQIYADPVRGVPRTRIILYKRMLTIGPDTTWSSITKFIDASKAPHVPGCEACESKSINGPPVTCNKCSGMFCIDCYLKIFKNGKGIITCPYCGDKYGIKLLPIQIKSGIERIRHTRDQKINEIDTQQHANQYNKLPLPTKIVNIKTIGFMKIMYKYIHESNPVAYKVGSEGYDLDDIVGAPIITDIDGKKYKVDFMTWCAIGDIYNIIMLRKLFSKQNLLPIKIDFSKDVSKWMADLMNKVGFADKLVTMAKKMLIKDINTFEMFTQYYKLSDIREYLAE
jgi:hypothetical protein